MPFITISRMYGSGGSEIAERVAHVLGWSLFDNVVVDAVAERSGLTRAQVTAQEERVPSMVERIGAAFSLGTPESMPAVIDRPLPTAEEEIVAMTKRVIEDAVQAGPAVFVGRGAQCLLAERTDALHVLCYAPRAELVRRAISDLGAAPDKAERIVADMNKQREQYVRRHWNRNWLAPENYHLCVDTAWLGIERASELIVQLTRERFTAA